MKQILLATTNLGKRQEMLSALLPLEGIEFVFLEDLDIDIDVEETGESYAENALQKARAYFAHSGMPTIAEDSGVEISALQDELGIHTRRWGAGPHASDEAWMQHFMERMAGEEDRDARFVCHSVYIDKNGHQAFEGECQGAITEDIEGPILPGIPLSAVFKPLGADKVYSAMAEEQKNTLSHRGQAIKKLRDFLLEKGA